jgi:hypothetical protein
MDLKDGREPGPESMKEIRGISAQLAQLALKRQQ